MENSEIVKVCKRIRIAYESGMLGPTVMPEDTNPEFVEYQIEERLSYFTLPMALNYQRDSFKLWEAALKTFHDFETKFVFDIQAVSAKTEEEVRRALMKYKLALQPKKHVNTWRTIAKTVHENWGSFENLIISSNNDFIQLRQIVQLDYKKGFPYLSGPKIFNYWAFILSTYGGVHLSNRDQIDIAPDTHITKCSVRLAVISQEESLSLSREEISRRWREVLKGSGIDPIDMHSPFWFWSRNGFIFSQ